MARIRPEARRLSVDAEHDSDILMTLNCIALRKGPSRGCGQSWCPSPSECTAMGRGPAVRVRHRAAGRPVGRATCARPDSCAMAAAPDNGDNVRIGPAFIPAARAATTSTLPDFAGAT